MQRHAANEQLAGIQFDDVLLLFTNHFDHDAPCLQCVDRETRSERGQIVGGRPALFFHTGATAIRDGRARRTVVGQRRHRPQRRRQQRRRRHRRRRGRGRRRRQRARREIVVGRHAAAGHFEAQHVVEDLHGARVDHEELHELPVRPVARAQHLRYGAHGQHHRRVGRAFLVADGRHVPACLDGPQLRVPIVQRQPTVTLPDGPQAGVHAVTPVAVPGAREFGLPVVLTPTGAVAGTSCRRRVKVAGDRQPDLERGPMPFDRCFVQRRGPVLETFPERRIAARVQCVIGGGQVKVIGHDRLVDDQYLPAGAVRRGHQDDEQTVVSRPLTDLHWPPIHPRQVQCGQSVHDAIGTGRRFRPSAVVGRLDEHRQISVVLRQTVYRCATVAGHEFFAPHIL